MLDHSGLMGWRCGIHHPTVDADPNGYLNKWAETPVVPTQACDKPVIHWVTDNQPDSRLNYTSLTDPD